MAGGDRPVGSPTRQQGCAVVSGPSLRSRYGGCFEPRPTVTLLSRIFACASAVRGASVVGPAPVPGQHDNWASRRRLVPRLLAPVQRVERDDNGPLTALKTGQRCRPSLRRGHRAEGRGTRPRWCSGERRRRRHWRPAAGGARYHSGTTGRSASEPAIAAAISAVGSGGDGDDELGDLGRALPSSTVNRSRVARDPNEKNCRGASPRPSRARTARCPHRGMTVGVRDLADSERVRGNGMCGRPAATPTRVVSTDDDGTDLPRSPTRTTCEALPAAATNCAIVIWVCLVEDDDVGTDVAAPAKGRDRQRRRRRDGDIPVVTPGPRPAAIEPGRNPRSGDGPR